MRLALRSGLVTDFGPFTVSLPPLDVQIAGPTYVQPWFPCEWFAQASGGGGGYSYQRSGVLSGSGSSISGSLSNSGTLRVSVTDANSDTDVAEIGIEVSSGAPECLL